MASSIGSPAPRPAADEKLPYNNAALSVDARVADLLGRMTVEEKAGQLFQMIAFQDGTENVDNGTEAFITKSLMTHFNIAGPILSASATAKWYNKLQKLAMSTRLGIPITISSDPRHAFTENIGTSAPAGVFSRWPESLGLAALRDPALVEEFADIARQEYLAVGIKTSLHPQIDLATEPRWSRIGTTMGEDVNLTSQLVASYIKGFNGKKFGKESVSTVTKHFPGSGPVQDGWDSHFEYGKNVTYPGNNMAYHLQPFKAAIAAGARQMMPYYSRPIGTKLEPVAAGMNKDIVTGLLKEQMGFKGIVVSDWGLVTDGIAIRGQVLPARAWGAENLTEIQRAEKILNAGTDQLGGEYRVDLIMQLVGNGTISEERINHSVAKLLREKFEMGLFDDKRYVDPEAAEKIVGQVSFVRLGEETQRKALTLLKNNDKILPLDSERALKYYIEGFNQTYMDRRNLQVVSTAAEADIALVRLQAPYEPRPGGFESSFHQGSLEFNSTERARQAAIYKAVPTIVDIYLDRPAAIPEIQEQAKALFGNFGASPDALLDVVFGKAKPQGKLPFDLPRSNEAVATSKGDVPFDTANPVFKFGHGLTYG